MQQDPRTLSDEALCARCTQEPELQEVLILRYGELVRACTRPLFLAGGDYEDLVQEGMIGLLQAIRTFDPAQGVPFSCFAAICIRRRAVSAVRAAAAQKHQPLNASVPFQPSSFGSAVLPAQRPGQINPEEVMIGQEELAAFRAWLEDSLSSLEKKVLTLYLQGLSYHEIAKRINRSAKSVDNAVQRIRAKAALHRQPGDNGKWPFA